MRVRITSIQPAVVSLFLSSVSVSNVSRVTHGTSWTDQTFSSPPQYHTTMDWMRVRITSITYNYGWLRLLSFHLIGMLHTFQSTFDKTNYKPDILERYAQTDSCLTHLMTSCITIMYNSSFIHYAQTSMRPHRDYILYTVKSQLKSSCLQLNSLTSCGCCWCASQSSHVQQLAHDLSLSLSVSFPALINSRKDHTCQRLDELTKLVAWWLRAMRECCHRLPHRLLSAPTTSAGQISWQVAWTPEIHCTTTSLMSYARHIHLRTLDESFQSQSELFIGRNWFC